MDLIGNARKGKETIFFIKLFIFFHINGYDTRKNEGNIFYRNDTI